MMTLADENTTLANEIGTFTNYFKYPDFVSFFISIFANINREYVVCGKKQGSPPWFVNKKASLRGSYST